MIIISRLGGALNRNVKEPPAQILLCKLRRFQDTALESILLGEEAPDFVTANHFMEYAQGLHML